MTTVSKVISPFLCCYISDIIFLFFSFRIFSFFLLFLINLQLSVHFWPPKYVFIAISIPCFILFLAYCLSDFCLSLFITYSIPIALDHKIFLVFLSFFFYLLLYTFILPIWLLSSLFVYISKGFLRCCVYTFLHIVILFLSIIKFSFL